MAKLDGVQTLDMQGGEITKIAYDGVEYVKHEGRALAGDLVRVLTNDIYDAKAGDFFEIYADDYLQSDRFRDNAGDRRSPNYGGLTHNYAYYRKSTQPTKVSAPFAEMITSKVDAVEKRVAALEGEKSSEFSVGDRVKALRDGQFHRIGAESVGRITHAGVAVFSVDDPYIIRVVIGEKVDYFRPQDLELASVEPPKPSVGDIVVITGNSTGSRNAIGDIGKIVEDAGNDDFSVSVEVVGKENGYTGNFTSFYDMRIATDAEKAQYEKAVKQAEKDAVFTKAGRKPNEYRKGDIGRITETRGAPYKVGDLVEVESDFNPTYEPEAVRLSDGFVVYVEIVCFAEDRKDIAKGGR